VKEMGNYFVVGGFGCCRGFDVQGDWHGLYYAHWNDLQGEGWWAPKKPAHTLRNVA
jgi:hypothetical protein